MNICIQIRDVIDIIKEKSGKKPGVVSNLCREFTVKTEQKRKKLFAEMPFPRSCIQTVQTQK